MTTGQVYCRHCEEQIEGCLQSAREQEAMRSYFLTLAWRWGRLARDLENRHACGPGCPLRRTCTAKASAGAEPRDAACAGVDGPLGLSAHA